MTSSSSKATVIFGSITALFAWFALGLQLYLMIDSTPGNGMTPLQAVWRFLLFFTVLTNLLVALSLTIFLIKNHSGSFLIRPAVVTGIAMYILVVGIVYNAILRHQWSPQGSQKIADELLHVAVPLLYTLWWIFFAPKVRLPWRQVFPWLLYPFLYLIYALVRGNMENFYAYPFIDVNNYGYDGVLLNASGLMVAFIIIGSVFILMTRILTSERPQ
jgi:hypothetical protein